MLPKKALFIVLAVTLMVAKQPVSISIQDQQVDLNDPNATVNITLSADSPSVPIIITYDDGSTRYLAYTFNYKPPPTPEPSEPSCGDYQYIGAECDWDRRQVYEVYQDACSNYDRRNYQTQHGQCGAPTAYEPPPPECEDVYYCDNGTTIHKHGYHDGNTCQYSWDDIGDPC